jgi:flavorubredoxin
MRRVAVVYATRTGETEKMARTVAEGVRARGGHADLFRAADLGGPSALGPSEALAVGTPTQEAKDVPEISAFLDRPAASGVRGKLAAAFGSYGWSGEGPHIGALRLERECGMKLVAELLRARRGVEDSDLDVCRAFGVKLVFAA